MEGNLLNSLLIWELYGLKGSARGEQLCRCKKKFLSKTTVPSLSKDVMFENEGCHVHCIILLNLYPPITTEEVKKERGGRDRQPPSTLESMTIS